MSIATTGDNPAPPPGFIPPATPAPSISPSLPPMGYTRSRSIVVAPRVMAWVPAICLGLSFLLTFFTWVAAYFAAPVYAQSAWQSLFGSNSRDFTLENVAKKEFPDFPNWLPGLESDWLFMLPYLFFLVMATLIAWADRLIVTLPTNLPPWLRWIRAVWPQRATLIAGTATMALILVFAQAINGFGMERAIRKYVSETPPIKKQREAAGQNKPQQASVDVLEKQELDKYNLSRTTWFYLGLGFHTVAVLGFVANALLARRGSKPAPRIVFEY